jgi:glycosyltransferase involved in cell wall biosynthesis
MEHDKRVIVIPAFNESSTIAAVVNNIKDKASVLVVDDGSSDETGKIAENCGAKVIYQKNQGYEKALDRGFQEVEKMGFKYVLTFDADGQHTNDFIDEYFKYLEKGIPLVLGVRPNVARFSEFLFVKYFNIRYGAKDILCGLKGYDIDLYREYGHFDQNLSIGAELSFYALKRKYKFKQIEIPIKDRDGDSRYGLFLKANFKILKSLVRLILIDIKGFR